MIHKLPFSLRRQELSLKRKLFAYMFCWPCFSCLRCLRLLLFGQFNSTQKEIYQTLDLQTEVFEKDMAAYWDEVAVRSIRLSENMTSVLENYLSQSGLPFSSLTDQRQVLSDLQETMIEPLSQQLRQANCSGAFVLINATANSKTAGAAASRSGLYLEKSAVDTPGSALLLYHGIAEIGKRHNIMPHRKWRQEFQTALIPNYQEAMAQARLPLDTSYRLSPIATLPGTSEQVALMTVPLIGKDGAVYGLCGFEVSQSWFKAKHAQPSNLRHMVCLFAHKDDGLNADQAFSTGIRNGYYFDSKGKFSMANMRNGLVRFSGESEEYVGIAREISVTQNGPSFTVAVLIPKTDYSSAVFKSNLQNALLVLFVIFFAAVCCFYFSRRFLSPVKGAGTIRANKRSEPIRISRKLTTFWFSFPKDQETEATISELEQEMRHSKYKLNQLQAAHEAVQRGQSHAGGRPAWYTPEKARWIRGISAFLDCLNTLTWKRRF
ncbi:MAG: LuxR family transcriptional regulator [Christensenellales bacterium]